MFGKNRIYWLFQLSGWTFYTLINVIFFGLSGNNNAKGYISYLITIPTGIFLTHIYRHLLYRYNALKSKLYIQLLIIFISSIIKAFILVAVLALVSYTLNIKGYTFLYVISQVINFSVVFFVWNTIYFAYHYFINYKQSEIDNLMLEAARKESELKSLKAQLNPHFMFNSMNSIRALIDEDPSKAKQAVTQLSNILRNSLLMNKNKEITLREEIDLVQDYLDLEKIRYEERLNVELDIDPETMGILVPPLIIQSQVENAIKHGISKLKEGGTIQIKTKLQETTLVIEVINTGKLNTEKSETGFGFLNSQQRIQLLYGKEASIEVKGIEGQNLVKTIIIIPLK